MSKSRILVADDDAWILRMVTTVLEKRGYEVETATDGEEAYEKAVENTPDLLITDVMMPNMDGWTLVKALRGRPEFAFVPVIFLTALSSDDDRIRGFRLGADDYLPKPFRFEELDLRVAKTMQRIHMLEAAAREQIGASKAAEKEADAALDFDVEEIDMVFEENIPSGESSKPKTKADLVGNLALVGISSLLTLMEMERKTGVLTVTRGGEGVEPVVAKLFFRNGAVIVAELEGKPEPRNELAIYFLLEWSAGSFEFAAEDVVREPEIETSTTGLLMEGARRMDERDAGL